MSGIQEHFFIRGIIGLTLPKACVEIGVAKGGMTGAIIWQLASNFNDHGVKSKYVGLDEWSVHGLRDQFTPFGSKEEVLETIKNMPTNTDVVDYNLHRVNTLTEQEKVREILAMEFPDGIDFVFIDGCHSYYGVASDFFNVWPFLNDKATVAFHDTASIDGCREFVHDLRVNNTGEYDIVDFPFGQHERNTGVTILTKRGFILDDCRIDEACGSKHLPREIEQMEFDFYKQNLDTSRWDSIRNVKLEDTNSWAGLKQRPERKKYEPHFFEEK